ncbi:hypothetical protein V6N13_079679 [Hibiscus sabdariffa]
MAGSLGGPWPWAASGRNEGGSNKNAGKFLPSSSASHGHDSVKMIIGSEKEDDTVQWKDSGKAHKPRPAMYNLHDGSRCPAEIPKKEGKNLDAVLKAETRGILSISYHMSQYVSSSYGRRFCLLPAYVLLKCLTIALDSDNFNNLAVE